MEEQGLPVSIVIIIASTIVGALFVGGAIIGAIVQVIMTKA